MTIRENAVAGRGVRVRRATVGMLASAALLLGVPAAAQAATWTVTGTADGGGSCTGNSCPTLRDAVAAAASGDTIQLGAGTYKLEKGELEIRKNLTIAGAGAAASTLTTTAANRLIDVDEVELKVTGLTLKGGVAAGYKTDSGYGGAIYNDYGVLRVAGCAFTQNTADAAPAPESYAEGGYGGAIDNDGKTIVSASTFTDNIAQGATGGKEANEYSYGGAVYSEGYMTVTSSTFTENTAQGGATSSTDKYNYGAEGGAIYAYDTLSVNGSTFTANTAGGGGTAETDKRGGYAGDGGALYADGLTTVSASTFSSNTAQHGTDASGTDYGYGGEGGAIFNDESLSLSGSTVSGNTAAASHYGAEGGGIYNDENATVEQTTITGNQAQASGDGGGFYNDGGAIVQQSTISGNQVQGPGEGGGFYNDGTAELVQTTISGNQVPGGEGGGIYQDEDDLELVQSTVGPANTAEDGAGMYIDGPTGITNSTIADNTASEEGGGIYNEGVTALANVTLFANTAQEASGGGNLYLDDETLSIENSLIAAGSAPTSGGNCAFESKEALLLSQGYNAEDSNQCALGGTGDKVDASLALGALQSNGGPTQTVALNAGSAAIDAGNPGGCTNVEGEPLTVDQRGVARPQGAHCDIGAFEYVPPAPTPVKTESPPAPVAPRDGALTLSPSAFAAASSGASIATAHAKGHKPPVGSTVGYTDSEAASTTFTVVRVEQGYRVGHASCKAGQPKRSKHGRRPQACTITVTLGSFTHKDTAGRNSFRFSGRINGHALSDGSYELIAKPTLGALKGNQVQATFKII